MFLGVHSEVTGMSSVCAWLGFCCELFWRVLCLDVLLSCFGCDFGFISTRTEVLACQMDGPAIRHCKQCRLPVPPIRPKGLRPLRGKELMDRRLPHIGTALCTFGWRCCAGLDG